MAERTAKPLTPTQEKIGSFIVGWMSAANTWIYRLSGGKIGGRMFGAPVLLLTTTGRKSGRPRTSALLYFADGENLVVVASKGGMSHHPLWYGNLVVNPDVEVEIGNEKRKMRARTASVTEKAALWPRLVKMYSPYDAYQARTRRDIPVVILSPFTT